jgi:hypothetical protein
LRSHAAQRDPIVPHLACCRSHKRSRRHPMKASSAHPLPSLGGSTVSPRLHRTARRTWPRNAANRRPSAGSALAGCRLSQPPASFPYSTSRSADRVKWSPTESCTDQLRASASSGGDADPRRRIYARRSDSACDSFGVHCPRKRTTVNSERIIPRPFGYRSLSDMAPAEPDPISTHRSITQVS